MRPRFGPCYYGLLVGLQNAIKSSPAWYRRHVPYLAVLLSLAVLGGLVYATVPTNFWVRVSLNCVNEQNEEDCYALGRKNETFDVDRKDIQKIKVDEIRYQAQSHRPNKRIFVPTRTTAEWERFVCAAGDGDDVGIDCTKYGATNSAGRTGSDRLDVTVKFAGCKSDSDCPEQYCDGYVAESGGSGSCSGTYQPLLG